MARVTLGLPFYGRDAATGAWQSYEDLVLAHGALDPAVDAVAPAGGRAAAPPTMHFNGIDTIRDKVRGGRGSSAIRGLVSRRCRRCRPQSPSQLRVQVLKARAARCGGVMIWEVGQDCRVAPVTHGATTHPATCPGGEDASLLVGGVAWALAQASEPSPVRTLDEL